MAPEAQGSDGGRGGRVLDVVLSWSWAVLLAGGVCRAPGKALCLHTSPRAGFRRPQWGAQAPAPHRGISEVWERAAEQRRDGGAGYPGGVTMLFPARCCKDEL